MKAGCTVRKYFANHLLFAVDFLLLLNYFCDYGAKRQIDFTCEMT